jgi:hypothetical protein
LADQPARLVIHGPQAAREVSGLTHSLHAAMQPGAELTYLSARDSQKRSSRCRRPGRPQWATIRLRA